MALRLAIPLIVLLGAATLVSLIEGVPGRLPGVALGSEVLLHVERAGASFAIVVAILSVIREGVRGRLPTQLTTGGLAYQGDAATADAVEQLQGQLDDLRDQMREMAESALSEQGPQS